MSNVSITTEKNTVTVNGDTNVVTVATQGPQGPAFSTSGTGLSDSSKVNKSIIYYDSSASSYKADSTWTTDTLTNGGNFLWLTRSGLKKELLAGQMAHRQVCFLQN